MKIGMITDSLGGLSFDEMLKASAELGLEMLEFACGNWSSAPHLNLDEMLESESARKTFLAKVRDHGLTISALNCSGNPLHPGNKGKLHHEITLKTFQLAKLLKVDRIVLMSGLPGGPGDANPNWIVTDWPAECQTILQYQWDEVIIPYWRDLAVDIAPPAARVIIPVAGPVAGRERPCRQPAPRRLVSGAAAIDVRNPYSDARARPRQNRQEAANDCRGAMPGGGNKAWSGR